MNEVYNFLERLDIKGKTVVAAISGGPDSMFLLNLLLEFNKKINFKIIVAHVHHNLRKESDLEAECVKEYCIKNKLTFEYMKIEKYPSLKFSEEAARNIRYDFFDKLMKKYNAEMLFTAHHGDDLVETVLMRITRGSNIKGYSGFDFISEDRGYKIVRPLIYLDKHEILEYLNKNNIWYALDNSNSNEKYARNRFRKNILPELKKENKNIHYKCIEFHKNLKLVDDYIKREVEKIYNTVVNSNIVNLIKYNELDDIIKYYLLERYLFEIYEKDIGLINRKHIDIIVKLIKSNNNKEIDLPNNKKGILEYNTFKIVNKNKSEFYEYLFDDYVKLPNNREIKIDNETKLTSNFVIHLNSKEIKFPLCVRCKKNGDFMYVKNLNGKKKISDILIDAKISKEERATYPIVLDATGTIIWIPGIKKSNLDRKNSGKYDIILRYD